MKDLFSEFPEHPQEAGPGLGQMLQPEGSHPILNSKVSDD